MPTHRDISDGVGPLAPGWNSNPALQPLREKIRAIERRPATLATSLATTGDALRIDAPPASSHGSASAWSLGVPCLDERIGQAGLDEGALHEIKPVAEASWAAACARAHGFALALAVRRLQTAPEVRRTAPVLICSSTAHTAELGAPYGPGLAALGLDPSRIVVVEPMKPPDVLWAIEEALKSDGLALVLGQIDDIGLTPARRLALAAARSRTPCLLLTHPRAAAAAATATRWRIGPAPSAPHTLDGQAPGAARFQVELQRCRGSPAALPSAPLLLEWCDAAYRFRMVAGVADRALGARQTAGGPRHAVGRR